MFAPPGMSPETFCLWYFRVPVSASRSRETRTSQVRRPREMSWPAFRAISYLRLGIVPTKRKQGRCGVQSRWAVDACY